MSADAKSPWTTPGSLPTGPVERKPQTLFPRALCPSMPIQGGTCRQRPNDMVPGAIRTGPLHAAPGMLSGPWRGSRRRATSTSLQGCGVTGPSTARNNGGRAIGGRRHRRPSNHYTLLPPSEEGKGGRGSTTLSLRAHRTQHPSLCLPRAENRDAYVSTSVTFSRHALRSHTSSICTLTLDTDTDTDEDITAPTTPASQGHDRVTTYSTLA